MGLDIELTSESIIKGVVKVMDSASEMVFDCNQLGLSKDTTAIITQLANLIQVVGLLVITQNNSRGNNA